MIKLENQKFESFMRDLFKKVSSLPVGINQKEGALRESVIFVVRGSVYKIYKYELFESAFNEKYEVKEKWMDAEIVSTITTFLESPPDDLYIMKSIGVECCISPKFVSAVDCAKQEIAEEKFWGNYFYPWKEDFDDFCSHVLMSTGVFNDWFC